MTITVKSLDTEKDVLDFVATLATVADFQSVKEEIFHAMYNIALDEIQVETVQKAVRDTCGVGINALKKEWKTYLKAQPAEQKIREYPTQADKLASAALERVTLFHTSSGDAYADLERDGVRETHAVRSRSFRDWLSSDFYTREGKAPGSQAIQDALSVLEGQARFAGEQRAVFVRVAHLELDGQTRTYLDLGTPDWSAVEVDSSGWRLVTRPPVRFHRPRSQRPLAVPVLGGSVRELLTVLNLAHDTYALLVAWLVSVFMPRGAFPLLALVGEQGTAKTTFARLLKKLVDDSEGAVRAAPRNEEDLIIAARGGHILAFDNLSSLTPALSDALCRLSTGGGLGKRTLYSDSEETILEAMRPVILTGISELATRPDLLDRTVQIELPLIPERERKPLEEIEKRFADAAPRILGALLTAVSQALAFKGSVKLEALPRMADFAVWVSACEPALDLQTGEFMLAYRDGRKLGSEMALEDSDVAMQVKRLMDAVLEAGSDTWAGTMKQLLETLLDFYPKTKPTKDHQGIPKPPKGFPATPKALGGDLRRYAPVLRSVGIFYSAVRGKDGVRVTITKHPAVPEISEDAGLAEEPPFQSSPSSPEHPLSTKTPRETHSATVNIGVNIDPPKGELRAQGELQQKTDSTQSSPPATRATRTRDTEASSGELGELQKPMNSESSVAESAGATYTLTPVLEERFLSCKKRLEQTDRLGFDRLLEAARRGDQLGFARLFELEAKAKWEPERPLYDQALKIASDPRTKVPTFRVLSRTLPQMNPAVTPKLSTADRVKAQEEIRAELARLGVST